MADATIGCANAKRDWLRFFSERAILFLPKGGTKMTLGEKIYALRTGKNMSQGDLAETMGVSRQSVSKWETDASVPDLDKLLKLSDLFEVSLDELVKGEAPKQDMPKQAELPREREKFPRRKIAGIVLFVLAWLTFLFFFLIGGFSSALVFASPFLVSGVLCFACRKNPGLWCAWAVFFLVDGYIRCYTTLQISLNVRLLLLYGPDVARLLVLCIQLVWIVLLFAVPVGRFGPLPLMLTGRKKGLLGVGTAAFLLLHLPITFSWDSPYAALLYGAVDWAKMVLFAVLLVSFLRLYRTEKTKENA